MGQSHRQPAWHLAKQGAWRTGMAAAPSPDVAPAPWPLDMARSAIGDHQASWHGSDLAHQGSVTVFHGEFSLPWGGNMCLAFF